MNTRILTSFGLVTTALGLMCALSGCAGYKLGSNLPPGILSVAVPVFVNQTGQPSLETITTGAVIEEFQKD